MTLDGSSGGTLEFDAYGLDGGGNIENFNACYDVASIEVTFTIEEDAQVQFDFIFASVEFPYYTGSFTDVNAAAKHKVDMLLKGFEGAFLVAFKNGKRVSMKEAGAAPTGPEDLRTLPSGSISKEKLRYKVQVGSFVGNVPMETMGKFIEIGSVVPVTSPDAVRYFYGSFADRAEADEARTALKLKGLTDAFVVGEINGHIIPADEADRLHGAP